MIPVASDPSRTADPRDVPAGPFHFAGEPERGISPGMQHPTPPRWGKSGRRILIALTMSAAGILIGHLAHRAFAQAQPPPAKTAEKVPAFLSMTYTDGTSAPNLYNLTPDQIATALGWWTPKTPATQPTPPVVTLPPVVVPPPVVVVPVPAADVIVSPGQSYIAGVMKAQPGQTVLIKAGTYAEVWPSSKVPAAGVTIKGEGIGKTIIRNPKADASPAVFMWGWRDVTIHGLSILGPAAGPKGPGISMAGVQRIDLIDVQASGHTFGVTCEQRGASRSKDVHLLRGQYADNWEANSAHSSGIYFSHTDGIVIDGAEISRNGWNLDKGVKGSSENHGGYVTGDCTGLVVINSKFEGNCYCGLQARPGGRVERNLFKNNASHLTFGLVNGGGPIRLGGVTGRVGENWFEGTHDVWVKNADPKKSVWQPRGYGIEVGNVAAGGAVVENNGGDAGFPLPNLKYVPDFAFIRVAYCNLSETNPMKGKDVGVLNLTVRNNAVTWPAPMVSVAKGISTAAAKPTGPKMSIQTAWPAGKKPS